MEDSSVGSWEAAGGSASAGKDDDVACVHGAAPVEDKDAVGAVVVSRSGGALSVVEEAVVVLMVVVAAFAVPGADMLLVTRLPLPLRPTRALPGVNVAAVVAKTDE